MARPKKEVAQAAEAAPAVTASQASTQTLVVDRANFLKVRDSVYARLSTIQDLIKSFSIDYLRQTNLLLGEATNVDGVGDLEHMQNALGALLPAVGAMGIPAVEEKKERKKRVHDPNMPKRPLTPYFLYMQTARPIIASDLGQDAPKGAVQEEGQRRWAVMGGSEKYGWNNAYQYNLRLYNARVHSYKNGNPDAKNMTDAEALKHAEEFRIEMPVVPGGEDLVAPEHDGIAEQLQLPVGEPEAEAEPQVEAEPEPEPVVEPVVEPEAEEEEEEEEVPAKTAAKKKESRKKKAATPAVEVEEAPASAGLEKKQRKRTSKAMAAEEEVKKSARKKARSG